MPGAGKSRAIDQLGAVGEKCCRLDADVVSGGLHDDLLADGYPIMPTELATLVYEESVVFLDQLRAHCLHVVVAAGGGATAGELVRPAAPPTEGAKVGSVCCRCDGRQAVPIIWLPV